MAAGTRRRPTHVIYTKPVGVHTTANPPIRRTKVVSLVVQQSRQLTKLRPGKVLLRKPTRSFGSQAPAPRHPKIKVLLVRRPIQRNPRGKARFTPVGGYQTFKQPLYPIKVVLQNRFKGKLKRSTAKAQLIKPVRFHAAVVQPVILPKKLLKKLAPQRKFQRGRVKLTRPGTIKKTANPPVRAPKVVKLVTRQRKLPKTIARLSKVVRTFGVTFTPQPSLYLPHHRPRRR